MDGKVHAIYGGTKAAVTPEPAHATISKNGIKEEFKMILETNENELTTTPNLWDTAKAVPRGKFIALQAYLKKIETFQTNDLTLCLQELEVH